MNQDSSQWKLVFEWESEDLLLVLQTRKVVGSTIPMVRHCVFAGALMPFVDGCLGYAERRQFRVRCACNALASVSFHRTTRL